MSKQIEALKQALEALEYFRDTGTRPSDLAMSEDAITAIREALAEQPAPFVLTGIDCWCGRKWRITNNTLTASEPAHVASVNTSAERVEKTAENVHEQPAQQALDKMAENARELGLDYEPVWNNLPSNKDVEDAMRQRRLHQLTSPQPAQPSKPLSSVELVKIELSLRKYHDYDRYDLSLHEFARAIEAAHGIKGDA